MSDGGENGSAHRLYAADELIVSSQHVGLIHQELTPAEADQDRTEVNPVLGLARVRLSTTATTGARLVAEVRGRHPQEKPPTDALDRVLWGLRHVFGDRFAGWAPPMGKNRFVGRVHGVGEISHGGGGDPVPTADPRPGARASGPGRGVRVGVLDTSLYPQPWLAGGWVARFSDRLGTEAPVYADGHATFVTGLVLSQAPGATVEVRGVLKDQGQADSWTVAEEIVRFGATGLDVLNLSFVCYTSDGQPPLVLSTALDRLPPDLVVVAAAGNHGDLRGRGRHEARPQAGLAGGPRRRDRGRGVSKAGQLAPFSPAAPWVDILAPGVALRSTYLPSARADADGEPTAFNSWARWSGTSFAAALVSGAIAAGTVPGYVTARAAAQDIFDAVKSTPQDSATLAPLLPLTTW